MEHKLIYLARRNPALSAAQFPQAWREHSQFAATFGQEFRQHFKNVTQCVKQWDADVPASFSNGYDGGNLITMTSREGLLAARSFGTSNQALKDDEERVFAGLVNDWTMSAEEHLILGAEPPPGSDAHIILSFLHPGESAIADFAQGSRERAARIATLPGMAGVQKAAWNAVVEPSRTYGFGAVIELWFATRGESERAANDPAVLSALEQADIADPARSARLLTRVNPRQTATPS